MCAPDCKHREPGCHADCDIYHEYVAKREALRESRRKEWIAKGYTVDAIERVKRGTKGSWDKYRPKGR